MLREDNADLRLTEQGRELGLVDDVRWRAFEAKRESVIQEQQRLHATWVRPGSAMDAAINKILGKPLGRETRALDLLRRPEVNYQQLMQVPGVGPSVVDSVVAQQIDIQAKYSGYIGRQQDEIARQRRHEETRLPELIDYGQVTGLSTEVREKLIRIRPATIGQAARVPGVTPAAISLLLVYLKKYKQIKKLKSA